MRSFNKCFTCRQFHWDNEPCKPTFEVYYEPFMGDDCKTYHASDHEEAAIMFAVYYNSASDYCLMDESIEIEVVEVSTGIKKTVEVSAERSIQYNTALK